MVRTTTHFPTPFSNNHLQPDLVDSIDDPYLQSSVTRLEPIEDQETNEDQPQDQDFQTLDLGFMEDLRHIFDLTGFTVVVDTNQDQDDNVEVYILRDRINQSYFHRLNEAFLENMMPEKSQAYKQAMKNVPALLVSLETQNLVVFQILSAKYKISKAKLAKLLSKKESFKNKADYSVAKKHKKLHRSQLKPKYRSSKSQNPSKMHTH